MPNAQKDVLILHTHIPGFLAAAAYVILWPLAAWALATGSDPATVPESPFKIIKADNSIYKKETLLVDSSRCRGTRNNRNRSNLCLSD
jgi:hypothetical protein